MLRPALHDGNRCPVLFSPRVKTVCDERGGNSPVLLRPNDGHSGNQALSEDWVELFHCPGGGSGGINAGPLADSVNQQIVALLRGQKTARQFKRRDRLGSGGFVSEIERRGEFTYGAP